MKHLVLISGIFVIALLLFGCAQNANPPATVPNATPNITAQPEEPQPAQNQTLSGCSQPQPEAQCSADNKSVVAYVCQDNAWAPNATSCAGGCSNAECLPEPEGCPTKWLFDHALECNMTTTTTYVIQAGGHMAIFYGAPDNQKTADIYVIGVGDRGVNVDVRNPNGTTAAGGYLNVCEALSLGHFSVKVLEANLNPGWAKVEVSVCQ